MIKATQGQTWALFCATGLDCRSLVLSKDEASTLIGQLKNGDYEGAVKTLQNRGATGKPKPPKKDWQVVYNTAHEAGMLAGKNANPKPIIVQQHSNVLSRSPAVDEWFIAEGVCGFAWIRFKGTSTFGKWAKKQKIANRSYPSGLSIWVGEFGQSLTRKEKYARAFVQVLIDNGVNAQSGSRMD